MNKTISFVVLWPKQRTVLDGPIFIYVWKNFIERGDKIGLHMYENNRGFLGSVYFRDFFQNLQECCL